MNKREREALCAKLAAWEWQQGGSSSAAAVLGSAVLELIELFGLTDDDMSIHRAWEIHRLTKSIADDDDDYLDDLCDRVDTDYAGLVDLIEASGLTGLRECVRSRTTGGSDHGE